MTYRVFLWDIDGTLLLAGGAGKKSLEKAFEDILGVTEVWKNLNPDGRTDEWIFEELHIKRFGSPISPSIKQALFEAYMNNLEVEMPLATNYRLLPEAELTLKTLQQDPSNILGLATGNFKRAAYTKLKRGGLDHFFSFGGFGCDSVYRQELTQKALDRAKEKIKTQPKEVFVIGDTIYDIRCGKGIGAKTVAVCTGTTTREDLEKENPDFLLANLSGFLDLI